MSHSPLVPLAAAGALLTASAVPGAFVFADPRPLHEIAGTVAHRAHYGLTLVALLALLVAIPRLAELRGKGGAGLPPTLLTLALVATALTAATRFIEVFVTPFLADVAPVALAEQSGGALMVGMVGAWLAYLVVWTTVGVLGWRRGILTPTVSVLIILSSLAMPVLAPVVQLLFGLALLVLARHLARDRTAFAMRAPQTA
jgi:hypothetical protein